MVRAAMSVRRDASNVTPVRDSEGFLAVVSRSKEAYACGTDTLVALTFHR